MKKRIITLVLALALVFCLAFTASAVANSVQATLHYRDIKITMNGDALTPKDAAGNVVEPFIIDGTTYLPVRAVAEALGLEVNWDNETSTVVLAGAEEVVNVYITRTGSKYHEDSTCNGGTYWPVPIETATGMGLTPCNKCVG